MLWGGFTTEYYGHSMQLLNYSNTPLLFVVSNRFHSAFPVFAVTGILLMSYIDIFLTDCSINNTVFKQYFEDVEIQFQGKCLKITILRAISIE